MPSRDYALDAFLGRRPPRPAHVVLLVLVLQTPAVLAQITAKSIPCNPIGTNPSAMEKDPLTGIDNPRPMSGELGCTCWPEFDDPDKDNDTPTLEGGDTCELECNGNGVALFDSYYGTISAKTRRPRGCVADRKCGQRRRLAAVSISS